MWRFSEAFMEACIEHNVAPFIGKNLRRISRQPTLNGFRPDLVFEDEDNKPIIIELQLKALDRYHLYKMLEYRDHWKDKHGKDASIILICEEISERYLPAAATHSVEVFAISRERFLELAVEHCKPVVVGALTSVPDDVEPHSRVPRGTKITFQPLGWEDYRTPLDYLRHIYIELARLGISIEEIQRDRYRHILWEIESKSMGFATN